MVKAVTFNAKTEGDCDCQQRILIFNAALHVSEVVCKLTPLLPFWLLPQETLIKLGKEGVCGNPCKQEAARPKIERLTIFFLLLIRPKIGHYPTPICKPTAGNHIRGQRQAPSSG